MRTITDHKLNGLNDALTITVLDEPGQGGACHEYRIEATADKLPFPLPDNARGNSDGTVTFEACRISFQNGPIKEAGVNGISGEALIAIVIDRLRSFQGGPKLHEPRAPGSAEPRGVFACRENAVALTKLEEGLMWLQKRTRDRLARGVEGTNQK